MRTHERNVATASKASCKTRKFTLGGGLWRLGSVPAFLLPAEFGLDGIDECFRFRLHVRLDRRPHPVLVVATQPAVPIAILTCLVVAFYYEHYSHMEKTNA